MNTVENKDIKIALVSLGCDKNLTDSETMLGLINDDGYSLTGDRSNADIIIINTCGFIADAVAESKQSIAEAVELKRGGRLKSLIVTGCLAQRYKEEIFDEFPVDAIAGVTEYTRISTIIRECLEQGGGGRLYMNGDEGFNERALERRFLSTPQYYAYLKIAEGCDNRCTYCTIPSIRGHYRSRSIESLVKEATHLAAQGVRELIIVAQDTSLYGKDLYGEQSLHLLLRELSAIEGIKWLRVLYCYPEHIYDGMIEEMASNPKVLHYIDMPIQHASDNILKLMHRRSNNAQLHEVIGKLRAAMPDIVLRTTLIAGFPGEQKADFKELVSFIQDIGFERLGVFAYSQEDGTPAARMKEQLDIRTKEKRRDRLMTIQKGISEERLQRFVGRTLEVIVEGQLEDGTLFGRSYADSPEIDGLVFFTADKIGAEELSIAIGDFLKVDITDSTEYDLLGVISDVEYR